VERPYDRHITKEKEVGVCVHDINFRITADILKELFCHQRYHGEFNPD